MVPPAETMWDAFTADSLSDVVIMQGLLDIQSESEATVIDDLRAAEDTLAHERDVKATVTAEAEEKQQTAEAQLAEVTAARDQQARFVAAAQEALDQRLLESANLAARDSELSQQIADEQAALAQQLATMAAQLPPPSPPSSDGSVTTATVTCPTGGTITVAESIAGNVQQLLDAAGAASLTMCGWGYRSTDEQIALRRQNCGTSDYAIWDMPSSQCSPPTARPGTSQHEAGLAIDFTCDGSSIDSQSHPCFVWLDANAATYGLYNYPIEPWHWSTTGN
jgi:LAS superfamily LD-carboxypeptidase LdcB